MMQYLDNSRWDTRQCSWYYQYHHKFPKLVKRTQTWTESCWAMLVAQRQAARSSVSFGSLPQGQADTAADTRKGEQSKLRMGDQNNTEANATTSALLLPILLWSHLCKQCSGVLSTGKWFTWCQEKHTHTNIFLRVVWTGESGVHLAISQLGVECSCSGHGRVMHCSLFGTFSMLGKNVHNNCPKHWWTFFSGPPSPKQWQWYC